MARFGTSCRFLLIFRRRSRPGFAEATQGCVDAMCFLEVGHQHCQRDFYGHALPHQHPWELTLHRQHYRCVAIRDGADTAAAAHPSRSRKLAPSNCGRPLAARTLAGGGRRPLLICVLGHCLRTWASNTILDVGFFGKVLRSCYCINKERQSFVSELS